MNDQELRLECLKLANTKYAAESAVKVAAIYYEFATRKASAAPLQEIVEMDWEALKRKVMQDASAVTWIDRGDGRPTGFPNAPSPPITMQERAKAAGLWGGVF